MTEPDKDAADFKLLKQAVMKAGSMAMTGLGKTGLKTWLKRGVEPVSEIDLYINEYLKNTLLANSPDYGWLSEESADDLSRIGKERVWVVDPIDGTRAFIRGDKDFSICVALLQNGKPIASVIYAPAREEIYEARSGHGAFLNNEPIQVGNADKIEGMSMQGDSAYFNNARRWKTPWPEMQFAKYQSFALRIAGVAAGKFDAAISARPKSEWDIAAADLILSEAGGICCDGKGNPFAYNQKNTLVDEIIATNKKLLPGILNQLEGKKPKSIS